MKKYNDYNDVKTFEDACAVEKLNPKKVIPDFKLYPVKDRKAMIGDGKAVTNCGDTINKTTYKVFDEDKEQIEISD